MDNNAHADGEAGGPDGNSPVELQLRLVSRKDGKATVQCMYGAAVIHHDVIRIDEQGERDGFLDAVCERAPAVEKLRAGLDAQLLQLAAEPVSKKRDVDKTTAVLAAVKPACVLLFVADDPELTAYVDVTVDDHRETHAIEGGHFRGLIRRIYFRATGQAINEAVTRDVQATLAAEARESGEVCKMHVRIARHHNTVLIDICNDKWEVIEVDAEGCRVLPAAPGDIRFKRSPSMKPLPDPVAESEASIDALRPFLRCRTEDDFVLTVLWLVSALRGRGPLAIIGLFGEQGAGKTMFSRVLQGLVDPSAMGLDSLPKDERNLMIAAKLNWLLAFDNVSTLPDWLSDAMCRIATGAGWRIRKNYTDEEFVTFSGVRPQLLNGIPDVASRPDFADRAMVIRIAPFKPGARKTEDEFWKGFEAAAPKIFAALLKGVSTALAREEEVDVANFPRMADFAEVAIAAEAGFGWDERTFLRAYQANQRDLIETLLAADPVAEAVRVLVENRGICPVGVWEGTATDLLKQFESLALPASVLHSKQWPKTPAALGAHLRRLKPSLEQLGITLDVARDSRKRVIKITDVEFGEPHQEAFGESQ